MKTIEYVKEMLLRGATAKKSTAGFSSGQSWMSGNSYIPTPIAWHGSHTKPGYAKESIRNLIWTSLETSESYWKKVFDIWVETPEYQKLKNNFEHEAVRAMHVVYRASSFYREVAEKKAANIARRLVCENIDLLPKEVVKELEKLFRSYESE